MIPSIILAIESPDDREFMTNLYLNYNKLMYSECMKILKDTWAAEDVMQTALEKLIDKIPLLKTLSEKKLVNYIITTCCNTSKRYLENKRRKAGYELSESDGVDLGGNSPEDLILQKHTRETVGKAWNSADEQTRQLLRSKYILEKSDMEIAEEFGIKPSSVRTYVGRARNKIRNKIKELEE